MSAWRKLARNKARYNMRKQGLVKVNKKVGGSSWFSKNWKSYVI